MESKSTIIAFYLPQYYPIKENDEWFGKGFTEWTSVGNSKPLYKGHYQPRVPADLGYYDLRIPEVRKAQADLAKEAGISAFCYYHYWFGKGKQMLEMPINEVVRLGEPDFPFCLAWANHTWYRKTWDVQRSVLDKIPLLKQEYLGKDDMKAHFETLLPVFKDARYLKVKDKLLFVLYRVEDIPDLTEFMSYWQCLAKENGLPGFYFVSYADDKTRLKNVAHNQCDASILSLKTELDSFTSNVHIRKGYRLFHALFYQLMHRPNVYSYKELIKKLVDPIFHEDRIYPILYPNWDNTPRRGCGSLIIEGSTPKMFKQQAKEVLSLIKDKHISDQIVFVKSWNEWGEGNYMEPDLKYGKGYIEALREALSEME